MEINQLQAFITVAQQQSFSKAAKVLHITQPAISKRIANLEQLLEAQLFQRIGQNITLTEIGEKLLPDAKELLEKAETIKQNSRQSKQTVQGVIHIATSHHIGLHRLPSSLKKFTQNYPKVQLDMHFIDSEIAYQGVIKGEFDLSIATLPENPPKNIELHKTWNDQLVITFSKDHPLNQLLSSDQFNLDQLSSYAAILPDKNTFTRNIIDKALNAENISSQVAFTTNYLETIRAMVEAGLGWSILPKVMLNDSLQHSDLLSVHLVRSLGIIRHRKKAITPAVKAFLDELRLPKLPEFF